MEDVLKYQRLQGAMDNIVAKDRITASALESNFLVVGTERGIVHILALTGIHIQKYVPHPGRAIRCISLCFDGSLTIYSCAQDDDTVVCCSTSSDELRTTTYQFSETITAIAVDYTAASYKSDGMILVGTQSGRLIKYKPSILFGKREKRVEDGKNSPVKVIAWQDNLVAWVDDEGLYLFDIATKSAIGRVPTPCGPGDRDLYPVSLRWTETDQLLLGWAYTVTVLKVKSSAEEGLLTEAGSLVLKVVNSWETDCVVAGIHVFDRDHVVYLGYSTLSAEELAEERNAELSAGEQSSEEPSTAVVPSSTVKRTPGASADLEVIVAKMQDGDIVSADVLPLRGNLYLSQGPFQFQLLSSYDTRSLLRDPPHRQWQLHNYSENRGGDQGKAPVLFIASPEDIVVGRVRDVNDRVRAALGQGDLKLAIDIAQYDRASLRVYGYADLLEGYITQLLESNEAALAAKEIARLAGIDAILWESWVYRFIKMGLLDYLCMELPTNKPRLERFIYEEVLDNLMLKYPEKLLPTLQVWSQRSGESNNSHANNGSTLYDRNAFIQKLERQLRIARRVAMTPVDAPLSEEDSAELLQLSASESHTAQRSPRQPQLDDGILSSYRHTQEAKWRRQKRREARHAARQYFSALAHLHLLNKSYEKALNSYLHRLPRPQTTSQSSAVSVSNGSGKIPIAKGNNNNTNSMTVSGSGGRRDTSVSTLSVSDAARQLQTEESQWGLMEEEDFDLESDEESESGDEMVQPNEYGILHQNPMGSPVRERRKALDEHVSSNNPNASMTSSNPVGNNQEHRHVFELIEREHLFHNIAGKIRYLVRLSKPLCQRLLLTHLDKLPIGSVAAQLQSDRNLLLWYLNALFADSSARETYRAKEFSQLHLKQLQLNIEHRARSLLIQHQQQAAGLFPTGSHHPTDIPHQLPPNPLVNKQQQTNELLNFLKAGWIPATTALQEIELFLTSPTFFEMYNTYSPVTSNNNQSETVEPLSLSQLLCEEKVYLLAMQGEKQAALRLLLETDDVDRVLYFLTVQGHGHAARYFPQYHQGHASMRSHWSEDSQDEETVAHQQLLQQQQVLIREGHGLWEEVVRRALDSPVFLHALVTRLGDSGMDGTILLRRLSEHVEHIPQFRQKIEQVMLDWHTMEVLDKTCRALQQEEALTLLAQKNRRQRRAIKIEARSSAMQRCTICLRPLGTEAAPPSLDSAMLLLSKSGGANELQLPCAPGEVSVCGVHHLQNHASPSSHSMAHNKHVSTPGTHSSSNSSSVHHALLFFNAKNAVHHKCFESVVNAEWETKRVAEESKDMLGVAGASVMERRGMVARTHHTQVHR